MNRARQVNTLNMCCEKLNFNIRLVPGKHGFIEVQKKDNIIGYFDVVDYKFSPFIGAFTEADLKELKVILGLVKEVTK